MTVGFIGFGKMGGPMAANVATAAPGLVCFDMAGTAERMPAGATAAESIADVARRCTTVLLDANRELLESFTGNVFHVGDRAGQARR